MESLRVRDYMQTDVLTVTGDTDIMRVVRILIDNAISGVPVVDDDGVLVGIITERDCLRTAIGAGYHGESGGPAWQHMTSDVQTLHPDDDLMDIAELFSQSSIRRCPVLEDGQLVGLIARRDVLRAMTDSATIA